MRISRHLGWIGLVCLMMAMTGLVALRQVKADDSSEDFAGSTLNAAPLCRYGVNVTSGAHTFTGYDLPALRVGWYLNYLGVKASDQPTNVEFVPVIRLTQTGVDTYTYSPRGAELNSAIAANPGASWLIGNEPDRRGSIQDNVEPHVYAIAYHDLYHLIKAADPSSQIFAGTIVQPTPLRLLYLDKVLASYHQRYGDAMPVDGWSIHNFILNETSCTYDPTNCWGADVPPGIDAPYGEQIFFGPPERANVSLTADPERFKERIVRFRQWMKNHGYASKPLYLTEYGILLPPDFSDENGVPFDAARVSGFMNATFDYMTAATDSNVGYAADNYRLVQKWSWYSTTDQTYNGWLFDSVTKQMTAVGQNFAAHSAAIANTNDFLPYAVATNPAAPHYEGTPLNLQLRAQIGNAGNLAAPTGPVVVRFYRGNPAQGGTQIGGDQVVSLAGCGENAQVSVNWNGVTPGNHHIFVVVDPGNAVTETDEANNTRDFLVFVGTEQNFIPRVAR